MTLATAAAPYEDLIYWDDNGRERGGAARMVEVSTRELLYQQESCGCVYSLRDSDRHRRMQGANASSRACCSMASPPKVTDCVTIALRQGAMSQRMERRAPGA